MGDHVRQEKCHEAFRFENGILYCDDMSLDDIIKSAQSKLGPDASPLFVYSHAQLVYNVKQYVGNMKGTGCRFQLNYSLKANPNLTLLKELATLDVAATLVSGHELDLALLAGFKPSSLMFNGCGKSPWETKRAIEAGAMLNVDGLWDLQQTIGVCRQVGKMAKVLLRLNMDIDPRVHSFINTGHGDSKFGMSLKTMEDCVKLLLQPDCPCQLVGLHSHLGSTISHIGPFQKSIQRLLEIRQNLKNRGFDQVGILNAGGGLAIDYFDKEPETRPWRCETKETRWQLQALLQCLTAEGQNCYDEQHAFWDLWKKIHEEGETCSTIEDLAVAITNYRDERISFSELHRTYVDLSTQSPAIGKHIHRLCPSLHTEVQRIPTPADLLSSISDLVKGHENVCLMLEPGRSLIGNTAIAISRVLGMKKALNTSFVFVDASMTEIIRPSLYGAYHHVTLIPSKEASCDMDNKKSVYSIVGPVCESSDFIAKDRLLSNPDGGLVIIHDVGAYCHSMASNYNVRMRPAELLIKNGCCQIIRRPDTFKDFLAPYMVENGNETAN